LTVIFTDLTPVTSEFFGNLSPDQWHYSYLWDFGDDSLNYAANEPYAVHTYTEKGLYNVSVNVTGPGGSNIAYKGGYIAVDTPPAPIADFTASPSNGTAPLLVNFIGLAEGTGHLTYEWNFGDNTTQISGRNPTHIYANPGSYNVALNVSDGSKTGSVIRNNSVFVREPAPLSAMFAATPRNGTAPLQVSFIDQSYSETPLTYNWSFGDGSLLNHDKNPVHTYTKEGIYDVTLQVKGGNTSNVINQSNFITAEKPALHKADFTAVPVEGPVPLIISFVDQSTGIGPFTYIWDFGDGSGQVSDKNPTHTYEAPGIYTVNETVNSSAGSILVTKEKLVNATTAIELRPVYANFSAVATRGVAPFNAQFMDLSSGPVAAWKWTFGDGSSVTEQGPNHTYINPGVYDVSLDVFNKSGVSNTTISPKFITALSPTVTTKITLVYADLSNRKKIQFFDNSEGVGINSWMWDFGDGSEVSTIQNPSHEYGNSGTFPIKLSISNGYASDSNIFYIKIK
jgi:PKD repeat protein